MLQDCFHHTDWEVFKEQDTKNLVTLSNYTSAVLDYICFCVDNVTCWKQFCVFPNTPPRMTHGVKEQGTVLSTQGTRRDTVLLGLTLGGVSRLPNITNGSVLKPGLKTPTQSRSGRASEPSRTTRGNHHYPQLTVPLYTRFDRDNTDLVLPQRPRPTPRSSPEHA